MIDYYKVNKGFQTFFYFPTIEVKQQYFNSVGVNGRLIPELDYDYFPVVADLF